MGSKPSIFTFHFKTTQRGMANAIAGHYPHFVNGFIVQPNRSAYGPNLRANHKGSRLHNLIEIIKVLVHVRIHKDKTLLFNQILYLANVLLQTRDKLNLCLQICLCACKFFRNLKLNKPCFYFVSPNEVDFKKKY